MKFVEAIKFDQNNVLHFYERKDALFCLKLIETVEESRLLFTKVLIHEQIFV